MSSSIPEAISCVSGWSSGEVISIYSFPLIDARSVSVESHQDETLDLSCLSVTSIDDSQAQNGQAIFSSLPFPVPSEASLLQLERDILRRDRAKFPLNLATHDQQVWGKSLSLRAGFMARAARLRSQAETIDLVLTTVDGETREPVHRFMLATRSPKLWKAIQAKLESDPGLWDVCYTSEQIEVEIRKITMEGFDRETLGIVVDCMYGQRPVMSNLSFELIFQLLKIGVHYELNFLLDMCGRLLGRSIGLANCCLLLQVGLKFNMSLARRAYNYITAHFHQIISTDDFGRLSSRQLAALLADNRLNVAHETQVWRAIILWIECCPQQRLKHFWSLFSLIRFNLIVKRAALKQMQSEFALMNRHYGNALLKSLEGKQMKIQLNLSFYAPRVANEVVMLYGGFRDGYPSNTLKVFDWREGQWYEMSMHAQFQRAFHQVVTIGRRLYVLGGYDGSHPRNQVLQIDLASAALELKRPMSVSRIHFAAVTMGDTIIVIGGHNCNIRFRSVEQWNPKTDSWHFLPPMSMQRSSLAACVHKDKIYVAGGIDMFVTSNVEFYSVVTNCWTLVGFMNVPRRNFQLIAFQNSLWAIGGFINYDQDNRALKSVERLDLVTNTWNWCAALNRARASFTSVVIEGDKLFVFGGYNGSRSYRCIELYTPSLGGWRLVTSQAHLPAHLSGGSGCVLKGLANVESYTYYGQCLIRPHKYLKQNNPHSEKTLLKKFKKTALEASA